MPTGSGAWERKKLDGRGAGPRHLAEPLHVAQQPVPALRVLLERDVEEDLIDTGVAHLPYVVGDLIPRAMSDGAGGIVEPLMGAVHEAAHHADQLVRVAAPVRRGVLDMSHHREERVDRRAAPGEAVGQPAGTVEGLGCEGTNEDRRVRLLDRL